MKERDYFFDNSKFYLITLVFIGHAINTCRSNDIAKWLYDFIYVFHMPAFVFISGYFSNKSRNPKAKLKNLFRIYIVTEILFVLFSRYVFSLNASVNFMEPYWILWFLVSLMCWEILAPYFDNGYKAIILTFMISLVAGYFSSINTTLAISRTIYYLPFFLLGRNFKREYFNIVKKSYIKIPLVVFWIAFGIYTWNNLSTFNPNWFYGDLGYKYYNMAFVRGIFYRTLTYILSTLSMFAFFSLMSEKKKFISKLGTNTLPVYVLHGFIVRYLQYSGFFSSINMTNTALISIVIFIIILTIIIASNLISMPFNFVLNIDKHICSCLKKFKKTETSSCEKNGQLS